MDDIYKDAIKRACEENSIYKWPTELARKKPRIGIPYRA